jgi:hypothetical protein
MLFNILQLLSFRDICYLSSVNKTINKNIVTNYVWKKLLIRDFASKHTTFPSYQQHYINTINRKYEFYIYFGNTNRTCEGRFIAHQVDNTYYIQTLRDVDFSCWRKLFEDSSFFDNPMKCSLDFMLKVHDKKEKHTATMLFPKNDIMIELDDNREIIHYCKLPNNTTIRFNLTVNDNIFTLILPQLTLPVETMRQFLVSNFGKICRSKN